MDHATTATGIFKAYKIDDDLSWGEGSIMPQPSYSSDDDQQSLLQAVLDSIEPVSEAESHYSACTDGRIPVKLLSGEPVPVREQMVGADMVSAFYVAEALGERFYKNANAPVAERVEEVAAFLSENDLLPSTHVGCGAAAGFEAIAGNILRFSSNPAFIARQEALLPKGIYDEQLHDAMLHAIQKKLQDNVYEGLSAQTFIDAVEHLSGKRAIAELKDDGRGVHGHVEEQIVRVRIPGYAINEGKVAEATGGREVFGVSDIRMQRIAKLFSRGDDANYKIAYMALEDFADAGHGTLAKGLPTYIVEVAA